MKTNSKAPFMTAILILLALTASRQAYCEPGTNGQQNATNDFLKTDFESLRDPFWPIGWHPVTEEETEGDQQTRKQTKINWPRLRLKGTTEGTTNKFAILRGFGLVEEGSRISVTRDDVRYTWKIDEVKKGSINVRKLEAVPVN
jgi:hypothetical protein